MDIFTTPKRKNIDNQENVSMSDQCRFSESQDRPYLLGNIQPLRYHTPGSKTYESIKSVLYLICPAKPKGRSLQGFWPRERDRCMNSKGMALVIRGKLNFVPQDRMRMSYADIWKISISRNSSVHAVTVLLCAGQDILGLGWTLMVVWLGLKTSLRDLVNDRVKIILKLTMKNPAMVTFIAVTKMPLSRCKGIAVASVHRTPYGLEQTKYYHECT